MKRGLEDEDLVLAKIGRIALLQGASEIVLENMLRRIFPSRFLQFSKWIIEDSKFIKNKIRLLRNLVAKTDDLLSENLQKEIYSWLDRFQSLNQRRNQYIHATLGRKLIIKGNQPLVTKDGKNNIPDMELKFFIRNGGRRLPISDTTLTSLIEGYQDSAEEGAELLERMIQELAQVPGYPEE